jgi:hypothetical protein
MQKVLSKFFLSMVLSFGSMPVLAQIGGLETARNVADNVKTGLYALLGIFALIYLIYLAVLAFTEKKSWSDFGWGVVHVAIAGATIALGTWAWSLFS